MIGGGTLEVGGRVIQESGGDVAVVQMHVRIDQDRARPAHRYPAAWSWNSSA